MGKFVYVDESGDESLRLALPTVSSFYVVCALIVDEMDMAQVQTRFQDVSGRYFKNREMKSSGSIDPLRRLYILQELCGVPFSLHILVGNKKLLTSPGLRYPKSFIKYLHAFLSRRSSRIIRESIFAPTRSRTPRS